jgi:hypothetical protein
MASSTNTPAQSNVIPEGFTVCTHNGQQYLVPKFMHEAIQQSLDAYQKRLDLGVDNVPGGVSLSQSCRWCQLLPVPVPVPIYKLPIPILMLTAFQSQNMTNVPYEMIIGKNVMIPADPVSMTN